MIPVPKRSKSVALGRTEAGNCISQRQRNAVAAGKEPFPDERIIPNFGPKVLFFHIYVLVHLAIGLFHVQGSSWPRPRKKMGSKNNWKPLFIRATFRSRPVD